MGIFGQSSAFEADIEKVTSDKNTDENWALIMEVCDKVSMNPRNSKECLKAIMKRMNHADPHVVMQAITLLHACVNNCGKPFHLEIASREFENEYKRLLLKAEPKVSSKMRQVLKQWAEGDFKNDAELNLIPTLYGRLRKEGYDFTDFNEKPSKTEASILTAAVTKDANVASSQQEEDDLAKAIELSLKEVKNSPKNQAADSSNTLTSSAPGAYVHLYPSLYPSFGNVASTASQPEPRKVSALYDFEAAEENELTFSTGEIIHVTDDSDPNWWRGFNQRGEGLFPANFVTANFSTEKEHSDAKEVANESQRKAESVVVAVSPQQIEIDEQKIDRLLHLLHEANPEDLSQDTEEMHSFEQEVHQMGPLIDAELERVDRKHAQLSQLSSDLVAAINMYHSLMRDDRAISLNPPFVGSATPDLHSLNNYHTTSATLQGQVPPQIHTGFFGSSGTFRPQGYGGLNAMPYNNITAASSVLTADYRTQANALPMQYQNGHINPQQQRQHQASSITGVPPQQVIQLTEQQTGQSMYANNIHSPPAPPNGPQMVANSSANNDLHTHQQSQQATTNQFGNYQAVTTQQQQQQPFVTQQSVSNNGLPTAISSQMLMGSMTQLNSEQQYMPPQQHNSYMATLSAVNNAHVQPANTSQSQLLYNPMATNSGLQSYVTQLPATMPSSVVVLPSDRIDHVHQQVANMSLGAAQNPSYTQNLTQNIPIYQQQR
uniref:Signal transducing adapter molecule 1 n=1 Tax=Glossina brevipalpis TaxID=37001 RepID=A0A1A9WVZ4_9MUSC